MLDRLNINSTQLVGVIAFASSSIACFIAARHTGGRDVQLWRTLALIDCLFLAEVIFGLRHQIHDLGVDVWIVDGKYSQRAPAQELVIILFATAAVILAMFILFRYQFFGSAARLGASISVAVFALFAVETVSLHALDAIFYRPLASVLLIGWIWAFASVGIVFAASWCCLSHAKAFD